MTNGACRLFFYLGIDDYHEIGNIIRLAKEWLPTVRGVFLKFFTGCL
jgi:hypothetical protein